MVSPKEEWAPIRSVLVMASEVQLDALPYVDQGYDEPGVREAVSEKGSCHAVSRDVCSVCAGYAPRGGGDEAVQTN